MPTQCVSEQFRFEGFDGRRVEAAFDGGAVTSDAGALLLREADRAIGVIDRVAACFRDGRAPGRVVHVLPTLIGQRIIGLALGYEDVADDDRTAHARHRPEAVSMRSLSPLANRSATARNPPSPSTVVRYPG